MPAESGLQELLTKLSKFGVLIMHNHLKKVAIKV